MFLVEEPIVTRGTGEIWETKLMTRGLKSGGYLWARSRRFSREKILGSKVCTGDVLRGLLRESFRRVRRKRGFLGAP